LQRITEMKKWFNHYNIRLSNQIIKSSKEFNIHILSYILIIMPQLKIIICDLWKKAYKSIKRLKIHLFWKFFRFSWKIRKQKLMKYHSITFFALHLFYSIVPIINRILLVSHNILKTVSCYEPSHDIKDHNRWDTSNTKFICYLWCCKKW